MHSPGRQQQSECVMNGISAPSQQKNIAAVSDPLPLIQAGRGEPLACLLQEFRSLSVEKRNRGHFPKRLLHLLANTTVDRSAASIERRRHATSVSDDKSDLAASIDVLHLPATSAKNNPLSGGERPFDGKRAQNLSVRNDSELFAGSEGAIEIELVDQLFTKEAWQERSSM